MSIKIQELFVVNKKGEEMKRKLVYMGMVALLVVGLLVAGCPAPPEEEVTPPPEEEVTPPVTPEPEPWPEVVAIGSGTGSTYYAIAGGLGKMMEDYLGVPGIPTKTSGGEETARLIHSGDIDMGFITPDVGYDAYRGVGPFEDIGVVPIRVFLQDFPLNYNLVTLEGSGIESWADLKGRSGYYMARGSAVMSLLWPVSLDAHGLKPEDIKSALAFDTASEWIDALKTGKVDFALDCGFHPSAKWMELATTHPMKIIHVDDAHLAKIKEELPWAFGLTIPGDTYKTMPTDVQTVAFAVVVDCHKDLPDDFIYEVTKMVWTHFDEFTTYHPVCKLFSAEAVERTNFAYHPGAIKYYKEIGVWTEEQDERQAKLLAEIGVER